MLRKPLSRVIVKFISLSLMVGLGIWYTDQRGYLNADKTNDHTQKKWSSFYRFTQESPVDILLLGNSHLYTGIEPENLSTSLGVNAFILASPGTNVADSYFSLQEAIKQSKPALVVLETYGINKFNPFELRASALSDQIKSFAARKDFGLKLASTPLLFSSDNFLAAWSATIRNHEYIFTNYKQIKANINLIDKPPVEETGLNLGRYVRFNSGLTDTTLARYKKDGAPVDGRDYAHSEYAADYVDKFVRLCKDNNIELVFLTLPMYHEHIKNYPVWRDRLAKILNKYPNKWINLQDHSEMGYSASCFEDTYNANQHMTFYGSMIATYELAEFIKYQFNSKVPDRRHEEQWHTRFYGKKGFFESNSPVPNDHLNQVIVSNLSIRNATIAEVLLLDNGDKTKTLLAKVDRTSFANDLDKGTLQLMINFIAEGQRRNAILDLHYDETHRVMDKAIFSEIIRPVQIESVVDGIVRGK